MISGTILHYEILEKLGEGGMGEVYKARDTKLDRFVALKFLPSHLTASEPDKARFIQEAKAASALNHPNVCTVHDIQEYEGGLFIVMEYIEGQTLRARNKNLSVKQIIDIGAQTAEGLAAAHEKGIVHRDIKPENIMIRKDGIVQIMDFGLAKLRETTDVSRLTKAGTTMGTIGYMSPEQVQGMDVDYRTDLFSLGVVLYELLSGEPTFKGVHETAVMYEIVNVDPPPLSSTRPEVDPDLDAVVLECLEKDKEDRCQSAKELARILRKIRKGSTAQRTSRAYSVGSGPIPAASRTRIYPPSGRLDQPDSPSHSVLVTVLRSRPFLTSTYLLFLIGAVGFGLLYLTKHASALPSMQFSMLQPPGVTFYNPAGSNLAVSPDGKYIAFIGSDSSGSMQLWLRPVNSMTAKPLTHASFSSYPFWSPDNRFIGYFLSGKLMKISVTGGPPQTICNAQDGRGGTWNRNGTILFAPFPAGGLYKVSADGGKPALVVASDTAADMLSMRWPYFLPDGNHFLFSVEALSSGASPNDGVFVSSLSDPRPHLLLRASTNAQYSDGYLFFVRQSDLLAQPFDPGDLKLHGDSTPLATGVQYFGIRISATYSVSNHGLLAYEINDRQKEKFVLLSDKGVVEKTLLEKPVSVLDVASLSPDGKTVAFGSNSGGQNFDIWTYDIARSVTSRLTFNKATEYAPIWSPDGKEIAFTSTRGKNTIDLCVKKSDGSGPSKVLFESAYGVRATDWSRDGKYILAMAYNYKDKNSRFDIVIVSTSGDAKPITFLGTDFNEVQGKFSPDGKWIAYLSNESGKYQVYVSRFGGGSRWQVSVNGGGPSWWVDHGKKLYYLSPDGKVMGVSISEQGNVLSVGKPYDVLDYAQNNRDMTILDMNRSGNEYLASIPLGKTTASTITVVSNWKSELEQGR